MFERGAMLFLYVATPMHVGAGVSETTDLAIQRNATTGWPMVQASGLKGALRGAAEPDVLRQAIVFGYDKDAAGAKGNSHAEAYPSGALAVGDAAVIAFPVASLKGVFAWVTCDAALRELQRIWRLLPEAVPTNLADGHPLSWQQANPESDEAYWSTDSSVVIANAGGASQERLVLQDLVLKPGSAEDDDRRQAKVARLTRLAEWLADNALAEQPAPIRTKLKRDLVLVDDSTFSTLVEFGIHTITRVKIDDDTGTAAASGPWDEELLPAETILFAPVFASKPRQDLSKPSSNGAQPPFGSADDVLGYFKNSVVSRNNGVNHFQLGAGATVGWGFVAPTLIMAEAKEA